MIGNKIARFFKYFFIYVLLIIFIIPFFLMINNSFKTTQQFIESPFSLPEKIDFSNYVNAFKKMNFLDGFVNSITITLISVALILLTASMAAYFLVRIKWKVNKIIFAILVASMIVPFQAVMIPLVSIYGNLKLLNNKWILIFMYMGFGQAFAVFIFHGFIKNIPIEMEEAVLIDGGNKLQSFFKVVLPLLTPVMVTVLILDILWIWNDYLLPSLVLLSPVQKTLPLSTYSFFQTYSVDYAPLMAGIVLTILPVLIGYIFAQKQIIKGVVQGAIK
ncbi:MAG: carbohydrate ABC transporter permease [Clostridiaceae bacterium]|jgi:raffinose/stachyose/melibiose transport system permease protein|nr:carbohydrate ABC transporter permease [Clostridiaceae bacterium]